MCDNVVLCKRPKTKLGKWLVYNHQVLRVIWVPPGENRQVLLGYLGVSTLVSMLVMFLFWHTSAVCKLQDACNELCTSSNSCVRQVSPYDKMTVNILNATQYSTKENWAKCLKSAQQWRQTPGNVRVRWTVHY